MLCNYRDSSPANEPNGHDESSEKSRTSRIVPRVLNSMVGEIPRQLAPKVAPETINSRKSTGISNGRIKNKVDTSVINDSDNTSNPPGVSQADSPSPHGPSPRLRQVPGKTKLFSHSHWMQIAERVSNCDIKLLYSHLP